ncbi:cytochrome c [Rhizobium sp. L1K21]|uniref:c-type cytochrome n=1 Tax=Rhizobium sp. L1K21 TaxID=2954933 RepID=UPI002091F881|nr:cytochrome c [Rhizobium sp. L1K21]MCO6185680.1 cytochrome c [Rhizobium sp. L1K21]
MKLRLAVTALALTAFGFSAFANETSEMREKLMKQAGGAMGTIGAMAKGEKPFDQDAVKTALEAIAETGHKFPDYFGEGTENLGDEASPAIWENMDDFKARSAKLAADAEAQLAQLPADAAGLGAVMGAIGPNCSGCHEKYRLKKQ